MKPHLLLLPFILLPGFSCKKEPAASAGASTTELVKTQTPPPPDPTPVRLLYYITDADMRSRTLDPPDESDPFAGMGTDYKYPEQQLAKAGLPVPKGALIARPGDHFVLSAPQSYHDKVAALLGVKGTPPQPRKTDGDTFDPE